MQLIPLAKAFTLFAIVTFFAATLVEMGKSMYRTSSFPLKFKWDKVLGTFLILIGAFVGLLGCIVSTTIATGVLPVFLR